MPFLGTLFIFVLQFEVSVCAVYKMETYRLLGQDVVLLCQLPQSDPHFEVKWRHGGETLVMNGTVTDASSRGGRLSVNINGSLIIKKVTASDAGVYTCQFPKVTSSLDNSLCLLSISPSPPDSECKKDKVMDLNCSLICNPISCREGSIVWLNETGNVLQEKKVGQKLDTGCSSVLAVNRLMGNYRRYSCRFVQKDKVQAEVHYTPVFSDSTDWPVPSSILLVLRIAGLILMICVVVYIRTRGSKKPPKDINVHFVCREDSLNYENIEVFSSASLRLHQSVKRMKSWI
ncbi:uncharacterized protein LOC114158828 isoform X1 [Xiphophorus couchianus]|uniref:uncharacterized protein LOC114158828 isoform X1 n=2 Tax=Xiphophorus couchianus TaxID=32473 RepID=UPI0010160AD4|nr:uncharacterized protein LOC114158828 isoform X1 [Xiphophorus couchianus]XP_027896521.1 uncharacterized protein LOC114158828 isoform X1 [Xiphophorus couchianus]